jgi:hypothetical protein
MRTTGIWLTTMTVCTLGSAAIAFFPLSGADSMNCMMPGNSAAYVLGIFVGIIGFFVSLLVSPRVVEHDKLRREYQAKFDIQAQTDAESLLRASECLPYQQFGSLLRAAQSGPVTPPVHLLRASRPDNEGSA